MIKWSVILLVWLLNALPASAQAPNLSEARQIWQGTAGGRTVRVWQIPRGATALIQLRLILEEVENPAAARAGGNEIEADAPATLLDRLDHATFTAVSGAEATLSYAPKRMVLHQWGPNSAEVRETFRAPGGYQLVFASETEPDLRIEIPFEVQPFRYLEFGEEFGFFVLGCMILGSALVGIIVWLHRRSRAHAGLENSVPAQN